MDPSYHGVFVLLGQQLMLVAVDGHLTQPLSNLRQPVQHLYLLLPKQLGVSQRLLQHARPARAPIGELRVTRPQGPHPLAQPVAVGRAAERRQRLAEGLEALDLGLARGHVLLDRLGGEKLHSVALNVYLFCFTAAVLRGLRAPRRTLCLAICWVILAVCVPIGSAEPRRRSVAPSHSPSGSRASWNWRARTCSSSNCRCLEEEEEEEEGRRRRGGGGGGDDSSSNKVPPPPHLPPALPSRSLQRSPRLCSWLWILSRSGVSAVAAILSPSAWIMSTVGRRVIKCFWDGGESAVAVVYRRVEHQINTEEFTDTEDIVYEGRCQELIQEGFSWFSSYLLLLDLGLDHAVLGRRRLLIGHQLLRVAQPAHQRLQSILELPTMQQGLLQLGDALCHLGTGEEEEEEEGLLVASRSCSSACVSVCLPALWMRPWPTALRRPSCDDNGGGRPTLKTSRLDFPGHEEDEATARILRRGRGDGAMSARVVSGAENQNRPNA
ncbi:hypothetical protein EYF80_039013 [Liparis tanakae]|uniref:Uncharacterized protein n=1 Tax=Liparis tanakae TaxID=230148 RepID=A0A4Z2GC36_9TELE|nr:hypothetical protein EYF80_039013 [Liparis tanakae]